MDNNVSTTSQRGYGFLVFYLVLLSALGSFVNDMFAPALPSMTRFFHCSVPTVQLGLSFGMIGLGLGQIILGPVSDRYGRKPVLIGSVCLFIVAAVVCLFSPTIHFFVGCRLFQGLGAAGGYFLARTIPADRFQGRQLAKIMAIVGAINGFAPASAPVIGGVVSDHWGWRGVFVCLTAFALIVLALAPKMKESLPPAKRDNGNVFQAAGGFLILLKNKPFMIHCSFKGVSLGLLFAYVSSSPFILQDHYGFSQTGYGLVIGANAIFAAAGSMVALKFKLLKQAAHIATYIVFIAVVAEAYALWLVHSFWLYELLLLPIVMGLGMIFTASNTIAMNEGRARAGEASAILGVAGYVVGAIVTPLVGVGNVLHATAIVFVALGFNILLLNILAYKLPPDLTQDASGRSNA